MSGPERRTVRVRRSPRIGVFLALGAALGAIVALIAVASVPPDPQVPTPQALGFLALLLAPVGALVGGGVAVLIDTVGDRRARHVEAELHGPDAEDRALQSDAAAGSAGPQASGEPAGADPAAGASQGERRAD